MILENLAELRQAAGREFGPSEWLTITQEMVNDFASATKDFQWIHVDVERARRESPFGGPIAHGFMTVSLVSHFLESVLQVKSAKMGVNYGLNKVRFTSAVPVGANLRMKGVVKAVTDQPPGGVKMTLSCTIEIEGQDKPACIAEFIGLIFGD
jgi:acyl dehydratase